MAWRCVRYTDMAGKAIRIDCLKQGEEFLAHIDVMQGVEPAASMALTYAIPSGWEIWNSRLMGGKVGAQADYVDIRDERISWYFSMTAGARRTFTVQLRAAYAGAYVLPPTICEDMYDPACRAVTAAEKTKVE